MKTTGRQYTLSLFLRKNILAVLIVMVALIGMLLADDYEMSWDEGVQRELNGGVVYNYVFNNNSTNYYQGSEKYHGAWLEFLAYAIEKTVNITDARDIFLFRHRFNFLLFCLGAWWFASACKKLFKEEWLAFLGLAVYFLSPRLFADAFYNSKDIPLFVFYMGVIKVMADYRDAPVVKTIIKAGILTGLLIGLRITGIVAVPAVIGFLFLFLISGQLKATKIVGHSLLFLVSTMLSVYACWPILWIKPFYHFHLAFVEMSYFPLIDSARYMNRFVYTNELPWHYVPVWIGITTPLTYILLSLVAAVYLVKELLLHFRSTIAKKAEWLTIFAMWFFPVLAVIIGQSILYDGWRHLFFIYAPMLFFIVKGFELLGNEIRRNRYPKWIMPAFTLLVIAHVAATMLWLHPYQNLYFNRLAGKDLAEIRPRYETDYWGLSFREAMHNLAVADTSDVIYYYPATPPVTLSLELLPASERKRFVRRELNDLQTGEYFIGNYRYTPGWYEVPFKLTRVSGVQLGATDICTVFRKE